MGYSPTPRQGQCPCTIRLKACLRRPFGDARREQGCRGKSTPDTLCGGLGRYMRVKGPWLRRYAPAGRTYPLTRTPLGKLTTELLRRQKSKAKAAQKGRK